VEYFFDASNSQGRDRILLKVTTYREKPAPAVKQFAIFSPASNAPGPAEKGSFQEPIISRERIRTSILLKLTNRGKPAPHAAVKHLAFSAGKWRARSGGKGVLSGTARQPRTDQDKRLP